MFKVQVDKDKCIGCGSCAAICPANFVIEKDGKAHSIKEKVENLGCNQIAAETCPVEAIRVDPITNAAK